MFLKLTPDYCQIPVSDINGDTREEFDSFTNQIRSVFESDLTGLTGKKNIFEIQDFSIKLPI